MPETAVVLCGGLAKRMRPLTETIPKCMAPLGGRPLLDYHLEMMDAAGIRHVILAAGYRNDIIKDYYGNGKFTYSIETNPLGTGGAVRKALDHVTDTEFFVINGDDVFSELDLAEFGKACTGHNALVSSLFPQQYGIVFREDGEWIKIDQKPVLPDVWANTGIYLFQRGIPLPENGDFETTTFKQVRLKEHKYKGRWLSINTEKQLGEAEKSLRESPVVFRHRPPLADPFEYVDWLTTRYGKAEA
ncbi:MAG: nucleotidyltransferase family protein [Candidatus Aenigmarchaeota archaeon]|nr:nucleotidyltransferase family protein [Candidatus Aenigmarchaeota archaeon]